MFCAQFFMSTLNKFNINIDMHLDFSYIWGCNFKDLNMKKITSLFIILITSGTFVYSQSNLDSPEAWSNLGDAFEKEICGTDQMELAYRKAHPEVMENHKALEAFTREWIANHKNDIDNKSADKSSQWNATYIIPVVYHVIHQNGPEKLSTQLIKDDIYIMNKIYNRDAPDTADVIEDFKHLIGDMSVEFRL